MSFPNDDQPFLMEYGKLIGSTYTVVRKERGLLCPECGFSAELSFDEGWWSGELLKEAKQDGDIRMKPITMFLNFMMIQWEDCGNKPWRPLLS